MCHFLLGYSFDILISDLRAGYYLLLQVTREASHGASAGLLVLGLQGRHVLSSPFFCTLVNGSFLCWRRQSTHLDTGLSFSRTPSVLCYFGVSYFFLALPTERLRFLSWASLFLLYISILHKTRIALGLRTALNVTL